MKMLSSILFISMVTFEIVLTADSNNVWNSYKLQFGKKYETTDLEQQKMSIFLENQKKIAQHNEKYKKGETTFTMALNDFSDKTPGELQQMRTSGDSFHCARRIQNYEAHLVTAVPSGLGKAPETKNWVAEGAVTSVKDQTQQCGSCWDFGVIGAIESHYFLYSPEKRLVSLSTQQILDCITTEKYGTNSCTDGCEVSAFQYVIDNEGVEADQSYPYIAKEGQCQYRADKKVAAIKDYKTPVSQDEKLLKEIVGLVGPCTASWYNEDDFSFYSGGIYSSSTCKKTAADMNHVLLIVGYGTENGIDYWLCKNQWGTGWGMEGYVKIRRNTNECGIALANYYPII